MQTQSLVPVVPRLAWTKDGWVDTLLGYDDWDDDATYDHLDLDFDGHDAPGM